MSPPDRGSMIRAASCDATKAARTPAVIMASQRQRGCSQKGSGHGGEWPAIDSGGGPVQLVTLLTGAIAAGRSGQTLVISHPELQLP